MASFSSSAKYIKLIGKSGHTFTVNRSALMENSPVIKSALESIGRINTLFLHERKEDLRWLEVFLRKNNSDFRRFLGIADFTEVFGLYNIAKTYQMEQMLIYCRRSVIPKINVNNVCAIYDFSCHQVDRYIQYYCWVKFEEDWKEIIRSENFFLSEITTVNTFASRPKYSSFDEFSLFKAVHLWILRKYFRDNGESSKYSDDYAKKMRGYMSPFFNKIRFLTMTEKEIEVAFSYNILYDNEKRAISSYVKHGNLNNLPSTICDKTVKRTEECYKSLIKYKHHPDHFIPNNRIVTSDTKFRCRFAPEEDCFLANVILPIITDDDISVKIKIKMENILFHEASLRYNNFTGLSCPRETLFLQKNNEYFLSVFIDMEKVNFEIKIRENSEFYIEETEFQHLQKSKGKDALSDWNEFLAKIRLYF